MSDTTYNGWKNKDTWNVALHINQSYSSSIFEQFTEIPLAMRSSGKTLRDGDPVWEKVKHQIAFAKNPTIKNWHTMYPEIEVIEID